MSSTIGSVSGVFLRPGASRNGRKYTTENIQKAVSRMQERIASPGGLPVTMNASHAATMSGDVTKTAAYVKKVWQENDGSGRFTATIVDTRAGRDVAALAKPDEDGQAGLKGVSIFGRWHGKVRKEDGCETADDLEVTGIDFTHYPGVEGVGIDDTDLAEMAAAGFFAESATAEVFSDMTSTQTFSTEQRRDLLEMGISPKRIRKAERRLEETARRRQVLADASDPARLAEMSEDELWARYSAPATEARRSAPGSAAGFREVIESALRQRPDLLTEAHELAAAARLTEAVTGHTGRKEKDLAEMSEDELWKSFVDNTGKR